MIIFLRLNFKLSLYLSQKLYNIPRTHVSTSIQQDLLKIPAGIPVCITLWINLTTILIRMQSRDSLSGELLSLTCEVRWDCSMHNAFVIGGSSTPSAVCRGPPPAFRPAHAQFNDRRNSAGQICYRWQRDRYTIQSDQ